MSSSDIEKLKKAILETNFDNPDHSENLNYLLGRYKKELEEEEEKKEERMRQEARSRHSEWLWEEEQYKQELERFEQIEQRYGRIGKFIYATYPIIISLSILLLLLSINDWWIVKLLLTIFIFLFKVLHAFVVVFFSMGTGG